MTSAPPESSSTGSTYEKTLDALYELRQFGSKLGLENPTRLANLLGNPHHHLKFIHIAGTNGKGSTAAFLESIYRAAGYKVGLYTSPHLVSFRERIQVNRNLIPEDSVTDLFQKLTALNPNFPPGHQPTFFEVVTLMALLYFAQESCDLVIWETGLGGRLDATNVVTPLASLITNVQSDHQAYLGNHLTDIAREKAGIIKPGVPALTTEQNPEIVAVFKKVASSLDSPLVCLTSKDLADPILTQTSLPLPGPHQPWNAALALSTVRILRPQFPVTDASIRLGLASAHWPGRWQKLNLPHQSTLWVDGAHNAEAADTFVQTWKTLFPPDTPPPTLILGFMADKNWKELLTRFHALSKQFFLVPVESQRSLAPSEMQTWLLQHGIPPQQITCFTSLPHALQTLQPNSMCVLTGSLYLVGQALEWHQSIARLQPQEKRSEMGLNDWTSNPPNP